MHDGFDVLDRFLRTDDFNMPTNEKLLLLKTSLGLFLTCNDKERNAVVMSLAGAVAEQRGVGNRVVVVSGSLTPPEEELALLNERDGSDKAFRSNPVKRNEYASRLWDRVRCGCGQAFMIQAFERAALAHGLAVVPVYITRADWADQKRYEGIRNYVRTITGTKAIPLIFENEVFSDDLGEDEDHDQLACLTAVALQADAVYFVCRAHELEEKESGVDFAKMGVVSDFDSVPQPTNANARGKIEASKLLSAFGIASSIISTERSQAIVVMPGVNDSGATSFVPRGRRLGQMKGWIGLAAASKGTIEVSTFLAENLRAGRAVSILAIGIEKVDGDFVEGEIVSIIDSQGLVLGRGRTKISSVQLAGLVGGLRNSSVPCAANSKVVVHYDYFVVNPQLGVDTST